MRERLHKGLHLILDDARHYQILCLACLLGIGVFWLDFDVRPAVVLVMMAAALATQYAMTRLFKIPVLDLRSPFISSMSLSLLLRTSSLPLAAAAAFVAIASKFLIRRRGKHVFNPTNFGIVAVILLSDNAWVSSGQWGSGAWSVFLIACLGGLVINRAGRCDVTLAVLGFHAALLFGRALWLGDPVAIPVHQLQNGALLIFAFFMISDPKTTPDSRLGRIIFALLVVAFAGWVQFGLFRPNGLLYALAALAPLTPLIDVLLPGARFEWKQSTALSAANKKGEKHEHETIPRPGGMHLPDAVG